jgi:hypothetical protein
MLRLRAGTHYKMLRVQPSKKKTVFSGIFEMFTKLIRTYCSYNISSGIGRINYIIIVHFEFVEHSLKT